MEDSLVWSLEQFQAPLSKPLSTYQYPKCNTELNIGPTLQGCCDHDQEWTWQHQLEHVIEMHH